MYEEPDVTALFPPQITSVSVNGAATTPISVTAPVDPIARVDDLWSQDVVAVGHSNLPSSAGATSAQHTLINFPVRYLF